MHAPVGLQPLPIHHRAHAVPTQLHAADHTAAVAAAADVQVASTLQRQRELVLHGKQRLDRGTRGLFKPVPADGTKTGLHFPPHLGAAARVGKGHRAAELMVDPAVAERKREVGGFREWRSRSR